MTERYLSETFGRDTEMAEGEATAVLTTIWRKTL
jgi:hypothetical protein